MKQRFTTLDIKCIVQELQLQCIGLRLQNIYDAPLQVTNKPIFLLKLSGQSNEEETDDNIQSTLKRFHLLIETGQRLHLTQYVTPTTGTHSLSAFTQKCRHTLRSRRLTVVQQLGGDRCVQLTFGVQDKYHLICELFAQGNCLLLDSDGRIVASVRRVPVDVFPFESVRQWQPMTVERWRDAWKDWKGKPVMKKHLIACFDYGPDVTEHVLKLIENVQENEEQVLQLYQQFDQFMMDKVAIEACGTTEGYFPMRFAHLEEPTMYSSFSEAIDAFCAQQISHKQESAQQQRLSAQEKHQANVLKEYNERLNDVKAQIKEYARAGRLLSFHHLLVDQCLAWITSGLASGFSWQRLRKWVEEESQRGHYLAQMIVQLDFDVNRITVLLEDEEEDASGSHSDNESQSNTTSVPVTVRLDQGAMANARIYFDLSKQQRVKLDKIIAMGPPPIKIKQKQTTTNSIPLHKQRPIAWFERFHWFMTRCGCLCVAARDKTQYVQLWTRHVTRDCLLVSHDLPGAVHVFLFGPSSISPSACVQAGCWSLCLTGNVWQNKTVSSAWFVKVSELTLLKTSLVGDIVVQLKAAQRQYLPPTPLVLGLGLLFVNQVAEKSVVQNDETAVLENTEALSLMESSVSGDTILTLTFAEESNKKDKSNSLYEEKQELKVQKRSENNSLPFVASTLSMNKQPRGKHGKLKKIKEKYADQDEEERQLRMAMLASAGKQETLEMETKEAKLSTKPVEVRERKPKETNSPSDTILESFTLPTAEPDLGLLASWSPKTSETTTHALLHLAPYSSLSEYPFRVKLLPGSMKRGKAGQTAHHFLLGLVDNKWKSLVEQIPEAEIRQIMLPNVKVVK